jgi:hypothetical protein
MSSRNEPLRNEHDVVCKRSECLVFQISKFGRVGNIGVELKLLLYQLANLWNIH